MTYISQRFQLQEDSSWYSFTTILGISECRMVKDKKVMPSFPLRHLKGFAQLNFLYCLLYLSLLIYQFRLSYIICDIYLSALNFVYTCKIFTISTYFYAISRVCNCWTCVCTWKETVFSCKQIFGPFLHSICLHFSSWTEIKW